MGNGSNAIRSRPAAILVREGPSSNAECLLCIRQALQLKAKGIGSALRHHPSNVCLHGPSAARGEIMKTYCPLILFGLFLLTACGGGSLDASPKATFSPTMLAFGAEAEGTTSAPQTVTLSNFGAATLNIASIAASANFGVALKTCGSTLASGARCDISVTFTPSTSESFSGTISVTDNASGSPQVVSLSGLGTAPTCSVLGQSCGLGSLPCCTGLVCPGTRFCGRDNQPCRCEAAGNALERLKD